MVVEYGALEHVEPIGEHDLHVRQRLIRAPERQRSIGDVDAAILDIGGAIPWLRWYIDPKTGYILREKYKATGQSGPFDGETNFADWRTNDGLTMPYKHENKQDGKETSNAEFKKIDVNPTLDPKLFEKPAEAAAEKQ